MVDKLRKYKNERNRLAHKMYSSKKLTKEECELAIKDGELLLKTLKGFLEERQTARA